VPGLIGRDALMRDPRSLTARRLRRVTLRGGISIAGSSWRGISVCICLTCVPSSGHKAGTVTGSACGQLRKQVPFGNCVVEGRTQTNNTPDHSDRGSACGAAAHRSNPNNGKRYESGGG